MSIKLETRWVVPICRPRDARESCVYAVEKDSYFEVHIDMYGDFEASVRWSRDKCEFEDLLRRPYDLVCWVIDASSTDIGVQIEAALSDNEVMLNNVAVDVPASEPNLVLRNCGSDDEPSCTTLR